MLPFFHAYITGLSSLRTPFRQFQKFAITFLVYRFRFVLAYNLLYVTLYLRTLMRVLAS